MGTFDDWIEDDEDEQENDQEQVEDNEEYTTEQVNSTKEHIAVNIEQRASQTNFNIDVEDGELSGEINDVAMLFAVMTMDFQEAEFDELINDEVSAK